MKRQTLPVVKDCNQCGACCTEQAALPIHLDSDDPYELPVSPLPAELKAELAATRERFNREGWPQDGSPCIWYDAEKKSCRHYEHRPKLCRDAIKPGDESCRRWRKACGIDPTIKYAFRAGRLVHVTPRPEAPPRSGPAS
jgi:uncharacterized protein